MAGFVLGAGEGPAYGFHEATVVIKASGQDTLGQLGVMESVHPPGLVVREHVHEGEDEMFYVLEGELNGFCEGERWTATARCFVFVPRSRARLHGDQPGPGLGAGHHRAGTAGRADRGAGRAAVLTAHSRRAVHSARWAGSRAAWTTPDRSSRTASRSTASCKRAAKAVTVWSAS